MNSSIAPSAPREPKSGRTTGRGLGRAVFWWRRVVWRVGSGFTCFYLGCLFGVGLVPLVLALDVSLVFSLCHPFFHDWREGTSGWGDWKGPHLRVQLWNPVFPTWPGSGPADPPVAGRRVPTAGSVDLHGLPSCFRLPFGVTWLDIFTLRKQVSRQGTHTGHCARP